MKRSSGFTLIELMVVIGIMILLASIVVTGSFGMSRASGYMAAENVVYNTLQAARQKACTDGKRVLVAFVQIEADANTDIDDYSLVTVEAIGTISEAIDEKNRTYFRDRASALSQFAGTRSDDSIWNLDTGAFVEGPFTNLDSTVSGFEIPPDGSDGEYSYPSTELRLIRNESSNQGRGVFEKGLWERGHAYGFQIGETQEMPTGFKLGVNSVSGTPKGWLVVFEPDGRSFFGKKSKSGLQGSKSGTIYIYEEISKNNPVMIEVNDGAIKVKKGK